MSKRKPLKIAEQPRWDLTDTWTIDQVRAAFGPAKTLGAPEDVCLAMDAQLADTGVYTLLQHSLELGQMPGLQFLGYGMLQGMTQNGLIRACIETVTDDMTREWITLKGGDNLEKLNEIVPRYNLQQVFHDACGLVGYEGGAFIFIDTGAAGNELENPLRPNTYSAELQNDHLRFQVIDPVNVFPGEYNSSNPLKKDYFQPASWWVLGQRVHASRLIRLAANEVPVLLKPAYNFMGMAQAQILWDYVLHFQECRDAVARLLTKFSTTVFKTDMETEIAGAGQWEQLNRRITMLVKYRNNDGILAIDKEEDVIKLETPLAGVTEIVRQALEFLAALNRTPAVKLLGISPSGFNATGESDIRNYYDHIASQQEKVMRAAIKRCLDFIMVVHLGQVDTDIDFDFNELGQEDEAALANVQKTRADTVAVYLDRDVISPEEARQVLAEDEDGDFSFINPDEVPEANNMPTGTGALDDVDKAGAVYDWMKGMAEDGEEDRVWRTSKSGNKYEIDTETEEITKGNIGQENFCYKAEPLSSIEPDMERYKRLLEKNEGNHVKAAHDYYKEVLQGKYVEGQSDNGPIKAVFTARNWKKLQRFMKEDPLKAELVPCLPDIINTGDYHKNELYKERTDGTAFFHEYRKTIETSQGKKDVIVDVAEKSEPELNQPRHQVYNMTHEGTKNYDYRTKRIFSSDACRITHTAEDSFDKDNLIPVCEVVNVRFA